MTTQEFRPGVELMANGKAVRLDFLAEEARDEVSWWCTLLFVAPKAELVNFSKITAYRKLHTSRAA